MPWQNIYLCGGSILWTIASHPQTALCWIRGLHGTMFGKGFLYVVYVKSCWITLGTPPSTGSSCGDDRRGTDVYSVYWAPLPFPGHVSAKHCSLLCIMVAEWRRESDSPEESCPITWWGWGSVHRQRYMGRYMGRFLFASGGVYWCLVFVCYSILIYSAYVLYIGQAWLIALVAVVLDLILHDPPPSLLRGSHEVYLYNLFIHVNTRRNISYKSIQIQHISACPDCTHMKTSPIMCCWNPYLVWLPSSPLVGWFDSQLLDSGSFTGCWFRRYLDVAEVSHDGTSQKRGDGIDGNFPL